MFSRFPKSLIIIIIASIFMAVVSLPDSMKANWPDNWFTDIFKKPKVTLGLDLQGGTQLDYRIDLRNAKAKNEDDDPNNDVRISDIVEGVRTTIERRVNALGVSEPQIYLSNVGDEQHIIVELAGIKDVDEAKAVVGKTIQLEFKEKKTEMDIDERGTIEADAQSVLDKALSQDSDFVSLGKNTETSDGKIEFRPKSTSFVSHLPAHYKEVLPALKDGQAHNKLLEGSDGFIVTGDGQISEKKGLYIVQLLKKEIKDKTDQKHASFEDVANETGSSIEDLSGSKIEDFSGDEKSAILDMLSEGKKYTEIIEDGDYIKVYNLVKQNEAEDQVKASHILIAYEGSERAAAAVTRTKEGAEAEAEKILLELRENPDRFSELASTYSDDPAGAQGGDLGYFERGRMTFAFEAAAFSMDIGDISDSPVETEFGYHIIQVNDKKKTDESLDLQFIKLENTDEAKAKIAESTQKMDGYDVVSQEEEFEYNEIFFDLTPDPWKPTGLDGSRFKFATVTYSQLGAPEVSIRFDDKGADMFEEITGRLVGQPLAIFVGGELISAPNVNQKISGGSAVITGNFSIKQAMQLANDLNTGAIDAPVILSGQYTISATLGDNALHVSLKAGLVGIIILALFMIIYYRILGVIAILALIIYSIIILFILKTTGIVMTLAGVAGIILSVGMAVDANILIFERTREELSSGKNFSASVTAGFDRAWSSIRDSNVSSLIMCAILWFFGNSIIRGFALMLAIGILLSMFTAITITRKFLHSATGSSLVKNRFLLGVKEVEAVNR